MLKLPHNVYSTHSFYLLLLSWLSLQGLFGPRNIGDQNEEPPCYRRWMWHPQRNPQPRQLDLHLHHLPCPHTLPCAIMHRHSPNADLSYCMILSVLCDLQQGNRKNLVCHLAVAPTHDSSFTKAAGRFFSISLTNVCAKCQAHMRDID